MEATDRPGLPMVVTTLVSGSSRPAAEPFSTRTRGPVASGPEPTSTPRGTDRPAPDRLTGADMVSPSTNLTLYLPTSMVSSCASSCFLIALPLT